MIVLETERLVLRELERDDLDALEAVLGDDETMRYYPAPFSRDACAAWIERWQDSYRANGFGLWAMVFKEDDRVIGDCGLVPQMVDEKPDIEIGWHVARDLWGRGLATEAAAACRDQAFGPLDISRLISLIRPINLPSCRVAEKIGMTVERETRHGSRDWLHLVYSLRRPGQR